jgi:hypothetical protein
MRKGKVADINAYEYLLLLVDLVIFIVLRSIYCYRYFLLVGVQN